MLYKNNSISLSYKYFMYILIYRYKYKDSTNAYICKIHIDTDTKGIVQAQAELPVFVPLICFADYRRPYN